MITLDHVGLDRDGRTVLADVDLILTERRIGIIGANGSGKSSLVRLFNGLLMPSRGKVCVNGVDTSDDAKAARRRVGFVFQNPDNQIVMPTVAEDLAFGLKNADMPKHEITRLVESELDRFGLAGMENRMTHSLSAGEKQLLAIAGPPASSLTSRRRCWTSAIKSASWRRLTVWLKWRLSSPMTWTA